MPATTPAPQFSWFYQTPGSRIGRIGAVPEPITFKRAALLLEEFTTNLVYARCSRLMRALRGGLGPFCLKRGDSQFFDALITAVWKGELIATLHYSFVKEIFAVVLQLIYNALCAPFLRDLFCPPFSILRCQLN